MQTQGPVFNHEYIVQLTAQIEAIDLCSELQALEQRVMALAQAEIDAIEAEIQNLIPLQILVQIPTSLNAVIQWVTGVINHIIQPLLKPYITYIQQLAQLTIDIANLVKAIEDAAARIQNCQIAITPPVITLPVAPTIVIEGVDPATLTSETAPPAPPPTTA